MVRVVALESQLVLLASYPPMRWPASKKGPDGIVANYRFCVYPGAERFPLDDRTDAIGVVELAKALSAAAWNSF